MDQFEQSFLGREDRDSDGLTLANEDRLLDYYFDVNDVSLDMGIADLGFEYLRPSDLDREYFGLGLSDLNIDADYQNPSREGASEEIIERLKQERAAEGKILQRNLKSVDCAICLEEISGGEKLIRMPCAHLFHESCIVNWLQRKNSCPLCRRIPYDQDPNR